VAKWPRSTDNVKANSHKDDNTLARGEDWALVETNCGGVTCNTFRLPRVEELQQVIGYFINKHLVPGKVWVCAIVSGIQSGILGSSPASVVMVRSTFDMRSTSPEHPLDLYIDLCCRKELY